ncbi:MAG: ABC transporter permease [Akkermansiaceae bacterium]|jgi:NitT/TauT family transport system permease protein|nr:ABC transporter permease [Akkermansiaceae bacterium]MDP4647332.1 ABC transporter permease [Akkermansiaceae bacterium]MDP4720155.1 ABC transporter permease [Akkermansiaceae bacterium]MDP4779484.1 ABC transporter permease [Akkermansiaceae bacterium]MDP4847302.1 ABC transporter permease [Akkermansiaceae bacterium]
MSRPRIFSDWFRIRKDLSPGRKSLLTVFSFCLPAALWCIVSYVPFIWHPDVKITVAASREGSSTVLTAGDHLPKDYFPKYVNDVREENASEREGSKRKNQKLLRQISPLVIEAGWLDERDAQNDKEIYLFWRDIATGKRELPALNDENMEIVRKNWEILASSSPVFEYKSLPEEPLLKLVPQGKPANPSYLPAPDEVIETGWSLFTRPPRNDGATMGERYRSSLGIIFRGFLWACLIGVPIGILCGTYSFFSTLLEPFTDFFRYMPAPTFSTLLVAVLAAGDSPKIALVLIGTLPHMILMISKTTRLLDPALLEAAQTLGAKPRQMIGSVVLPGIAPNLYNDLRILLGWAWTWLVIAELIGVKSGLTEVIETQGRFRNFDQVFPVIILIGITGFVTDQILAWFHGVLFPWAGTSGRISRAVASFVTWPIRTVASAANERIMQDELAREARRKLRPSTESP